MPSRIFFFFFFFFFLLLLLLFRQSSKNLNFPQLFTTPYVRSSSTTTLCTIMMSTIGGEILPNAIQHRGCMTSQFVHHLILKQKSQTLFIIFKSIAAVQKVFPSCFSLYKFQIHSKPVITNPDKPNYRFLDQGKFCFITIASQIKRSPYNEFWA